VQEAHAGARSSRLSGRGGRGRGGDAGVELVLGDGQRRAEPHVWVPQPSTNTFSSRSIRSDDLVAELPVGQVDGAHQPAAARVVEQLVAVGEVLQLLQQLGAELGGAVDQPVPLDHLEDDGGAHHVGEVATEGGVDPRRGPEDVPSTSSSRPPAMTPQTWVFLPNATRSGVIPSCW
jgi:hypothetical protein